MATNVEEVEVWQNGTPVVNMVNDTEFDSSDMDTPDADQSGETPRRRASEF